ncbi:MAG: hypothetical protein AAF697_06600 [Pseudomonadota bacterium]
MKIRSLSPVALGLSALGLALVPTPAHADDLWSTSHFAPPADPQVPADDHSGVLRVESGKADHFDINTNLFRMRRASLDLDTIPPLEIALVQDGARMIPVQRGPIRGSHIHWEWIVQPGTIWETDGGETRLSLPVALTERNANCVHNGLLTLTLDEPQTTADFQIASETCAYFKVDMTAQLDASFDMQAVPDAEVITRADLRERTARLPTRPISELPFRDQLASSSEVEPEAITGFGIVLDGTHYVSACPTRAGLYPFCDEMVLPSYSWAKSIFAGIAAMRMEKLYPGTRNLSIQTYVGGCEDDWADVAIEDTLNMTSGHYNDRGHEVDEGGELMRRFFLAEAHPDKILLACRAFSRRTDPGERFVYRTADTYITGTALTAALRTEKQSVEADLQRDILDPLWAQLSLSPLVSQTRRTYDESAIPFAGWGLYLTRGDLVRITAFLQRGGQIDGEDFLDTAMLAEALQQGAAPFGLEAVSSDQRYRHGFWAWNAGEYLGCPTEQWIPLMSGYGGLTAALLPSGDLYYYVSDGFAYRSAKAIAAIHQVSAQC